ncbi:GntR family transcriptional regulator [Sinanaerobacter chloroacetimidivorans]|jgi:DNA-binding GntR family transcriptional regulator|uniref:GntR family transcriptional regulator n=1 Tax=Sinanaerobacter chloroacetimidivorans TaxID=2818044 RepID=A0A8J7W2N1_9FIRM|nr:GntR family transcriptional regulator [Sinanaerobacter chloroacetimidivorans]MBR0599256.1 GntR family transcriptional regulator [Sinanaerobacter chloroacetimidivorans]
MAEEATKKQLKKRSLFREEICDYIKESILSGELKPGDRIVETRCAKELGVSQSPVREAIRELEIIGLVENIPFQGCYVKEHTIKDVKDSYKVRISLETLGMMYAVQNITDEQLQDLFNVMKEMEAAAENHEFDLYIKLDALFHQKIIEVSENKMLLRLWSQCYIREWTYIATKKLSDKGLKNLAVRHESIYDALAERNEGKALQAAISHLEELIVEMEAKQKE